MLSRLETIRNTQIKAHEFISKYLRQQQIPENDKLRTNTASIINIAKLLLRLH